MLLVIGGVESLGLFAYAVSLIFNSLVSGTSGASGSDLSPWVLFIVYLALSAAVALIVRGLWRFSAAARTPFLLTQAFAIVVAEPLASGGEQFERWLAWLLIAIAIAGAVLILSRQASAALR